MAKTEIKYSIQELLGVGFTLLVLGIGLAYGLEVNGDLKEDFAVDSCAGRTDEFTAYNTTSGNCYNGSDAGQAEAGAPQSAQFNATSDTALSVGNLTAKLPTIATVVVASVVIGILVTYLWMRFAKL